MEHYKFLSTGRVRHNRLRYGHRQTRRALRGPLFPTQEYWRLLPGVGQSWAWRGSGNLHPLLQLRRYASTQENDWQWICSFIYLLIIALVIFFTNSKGLKNNLIKENIDKLICNLSLSRLQMMQKVWNNSWVIIVNFFIYLFMFNFDFIYHFWDCSASTQLLATIQGGSFFTFPFIIPHSTVHAYFSLSHSKTFIIFHKTHSIRHFLSNSSAQLAHLKCPLFQPSLSDLC